MGDSLVDKVKNAMPQEEDLIEVAELFKAFGLNCALVIWRCSWR